MRETTFIRGLVRFDRIEGVNQYARLNGVWISAQAIILIQLQAQTAVRGTKLVANENTLPLEYDMSLFYFFAGCCSLLSYPDFLVDRMSFWRIRGYHKTLSIERCVLKSTT
jgi:hypothetical protein